MGRWRLIRPRDWVPLHLEEILYRAPDGSAPILTGTMLVREARPGCHLIGVGRRNFFADVRDVFPAPGWKRERELRELEAEDLPPVMPTAGEECQGSQAHGCAGESVF